MKKILFATLSLVFAAFLFSACDDTFDDLMTGNVKTGGMLYPTTGVPYKLGATPSFDITLNIPKGPAIESIEIYKKYTGKAEVLDQTISIGGANATAVVTKTVTLTYAQLIAGLTGMPADESTLVIGDAWTLRYESVMADDGRNVRVATPTIVTVANQYAGYYQCVGIFYHPTAGERPINEEKYMTPIDASSCWANAGDLGGDPYFVKITVNADNSVTCSTYEDYIEMSNVAGEASTWDPVTGVFTLNYQYIGSTGARVMREVWTPK